MCALAQTVMMTIVDAGTNKKHHTSVVLFKPKTLLNHYRTKNMENTPEQNNTPVENASEKKEMVPVGQVFPKFPTQAEWNTLNTIAATLKNGGVLPKGIDTVQKMVVVLQAGREIGLQPIEALNSLYFVNGKVAMYGEAVPMQIMRAGHSIKWGKCDKNEATVTITRGDNGDSMTQTFTMAEAVERGYTSNPIYKKYPENMLKWRVLGMTAKFIAPDALRGIGIKEDMEVEVVDEGGRFHNKEEAGRVKGEIADGTYSKRKPLDEALDETDSEEDVQVEADETNELEKAVALGTGCRKCGKITKSVAGMTKHLASAHGIVRKPDGTIVEVTGEKIDEKETN